MYHQLLKRTFFLMTLCGSVMLSAGDDAWSKSGSHYSYTRTGKIAPEFLPDGGIKYTFSLGCPEYPFDAGTGSCTPGDLKYSGNATRGPASGVTGTVEYGKDELPTSDTSMSMSGKLIPPEGTEGSQPTWSASATLQSPFWLEASPADMVKVGTVVTITAKGDPTESTWTINNTAWKNGGANPVKTSSVVLNRNMWDKMGWTPNPVPTGYLFPPAGTYAIAATTTEEENARSADITVKVIGVKSLSTSVGSRTITSVTDNPGEAESVLIDAPNTNPDIAATTLTFTATPEPGPDWLTDYPKWKVNGTEVQAGGGTYEFSTAGKSAGKYTVAVECGNEAAIDVYVVSCEYQIIVDTPGTGAIDITWSGNIPVACSVGHASWRFNVLPSEAVDIEPLKTYKDILRKNIGFHANSNTVVLTGETAAPTPSLHIPDAAAGKLKTEKIPLANLLAGAAFTNPLRTRAGDYRLGTRCIATKTVLGKTITPIDWTHATTRNCASMAVDAGGASGVTLPSALGTWTGPIAGFVATYSGEMPWVLHGRL